VAVASVAAGVAVAAAVAALAPGAGDSAATLGLGFGFGVAAGAAVSVFLAGAATFFFLRAGVGVGVRTKKSRTFLEKLSSSSSAPRTGVTRASAALIMTRNRSVFFIPESWHQSRSHFLQDSFIHSNAGVEILQREILVR